MTKKNSSNVRLAINGFGRIGRAAFKIAYDKGLNIVCINDLADTNTLAYLLKHDSVYGLYDKDVSCDDQHIIVEGNKFEVLAEKDPKNIPWREKEIDVVLECTGRFTKNDEAKAHLEGGAKKVIVSAPSKGGSTKTFVLGVNDSKYDNDNLISNASCTTNCISPVVQVIHDNFKISKAIMTTIHSYTADQRLIDAPHKDLRRGRSAALNIVPTTTGAAIATTEVIPELQGLFDGLSVRVPTPVGSLSDITFLLEKEVSEEEVNEAFKKAAAASRYENILDVSEEPLVSTDIIKSNYSAIVDLSLTKVVGKNLVKVVAWYDNEWGYANRLVDMALVAGRGI